MHTTSVFRLVGGLVWLMLTLASCSGLPMSGPQGDAWQPQWDHLFANDVRVRSVARAASLLVFEPRLPRSIQEDPAMFITRPETTRAGFRNFGLRYRQSRYGLFWIIERITESSQAELETLPARCRPETGCSTHARIVELDDGTRALLLEDGQAATSVMWLKGRVEFRVLGPVDTLSADEAVAIANAVTA